MNFIRSISCYNNITYSFVWAFLTTCYIYIAFLVILKFQQMEIHYRKQRGGKMKKFFNFKSIKTKMLFGFSIVLALVIVLGIFNILVMDDVNKTTEDVLNKEIPLLIADEQLAQGMYNRIGAARAYVLSGDSFYIDIFNEETEDALINEDTIRKHANNEEFETLVQNTIEWRDYIIEDVFNEYDKGNADLAIENLLTAETYIGGLIDGYEELALNREKEIIELEEGILTKGKNTLIIIVGTTLFVIAAAFTVAIVTANSITRPIRSVMTKMSLMAEGDLSVEPLETKSRDEVAQLVAATNELNDSTRDVLSQINHVSETVTGQSEELSQSASEVRAGSEQIAITMEELATGSASQASTASDLSETMVSFTSKVEEVNENSERINRSSNYVLELTTEGSQLMDSSTKQMTAIDQVVHNAVEKVEGLDTHAQEISELVSVIQDIAAQTNLLALNAAIEAARAGEHGQGFAVVADEVRKLAEQSSASVTNITDIVNRIQSESGIVVESLRDGYKDVEEGTTQIVTTGKMFTGITSAVEDMVNNISAISDNIADIAASTQEMNGSIQEVAAISEESAAGVEETTASSEQSSSIMQEVAGSSEQLATLAEELNRLVNQFKL